MSDKDQNRSHSERLIRKITKPLNPTYSPDQLAMFGGEPLEGSGFEAETPEPDSEWRDPQ
jgi:hypothetical protein